MLAPDAPLVFLGAGDGGVADVEADVTAALVDLIGDGREHAAGRTLGATTATPTTRPPVARPRAAAPAYRRPARGVPDLDVAPRLTPRSPRGRSCAAST